MPLRVLPSVLPEAVALPLRSIHWVPFQPASLRLVVFGEAADIGYRYRYRKAIVVAGNRYPIPEACLADGLQWGRNSRDAVGTAI